jgi:hypothetical protein
MSNPRATSATAAANDAPKVSSYAARARSVQTVPQKVSHVSVLALAKQAASGMSTRMVR